MGLVASSCQACASKATTRRPCLTIDTLAKLSSARPERYLLEWHKKADSRSSNPLLYLGRHTEFIIRRCFLPYVILFFALFGIMNWFLIGATVGANIVWIVALYSYLTFTPSRTTALQSFTSLG